jgi:tetratricopeptide (TPR) repeat protein
MRALGYYQNAIAHDPNCKHAYNGLGIIYENANNDRKAILNFNKAI